MSPLNEEWPDLPDGVCISEHHNESVAASGAHDDMFSLTIAEYRQLLADKELLEATCSDLIGVLRRTLNSIMVGATPYSMYEEIEAALQPVPDPPPPDPTGCAHCIQPDPRTMLRNCMELHGDPRTRVPHDHTLPGGQHQAEAA